MKINKKGFTLAEMAIALSIIAVLSVISYYAYSESDKKAKVTRITKNVRHYQEVVQTNILQLKKGEKLKVKYDSSGDGPLGGVISPKDIKFENTNYFVLKSSGFGDGDIIFGNVRINGSERGSLVIGYAIGDTKDCILDDKIYFCDSGIKTSEYISNDSTCKDYFSFGMADKKKVNFCAVKVVDDFYNKIEIESGGKI